MFSRLPLLLAGTIALCAPAVAFAGTPLICHPYNIGSAQSLPAGNDWHGVDKAYDRTHLVADTLALLTPDTPVIVRMETMRRAAVYATAGLRSWDKGAYTAEDRALALGLIEKLRQRAEQAKGSERALALFDLGFFTETMRQTNVDKSFNGYDLLVQARELRGPDAEMEFALALASSWPKRAEHDRHIALARSGAKPGSLLAQNLESHFGRS
jgi:hypothetical protein